MEVKKQQQPTFHRPHLFPWPPFCCLPSSRASPLDVTVAARGLLLINALGGKSGQMYNLLDMIIVIIEYHYY